MIPLRFSSSAPSSLLVVTLLVLTLAGCSKSSGGGGSLSSASTAATPATPQAATPASTMPGSTTAPGSTVAPVPSAAVPVKPVLVICGLQAEEQIAQGPNVVVVLSAGDTSLLRARLANLNVNDYQAVVSFGVSGGLLPGYKCGDLMLARSVVSQNAPRGPWTPDVNLTTTIIAKLAAGGVNATAGVFVGDDDLALNNGPGPKAALRAATGADNVDMESHVAAAFAASGNVPFVAIRSPSDDYTETLPPAALVPLKQDGSTDYGSVALSVITNPWQIPALFQLNTDTNAALATLKKARAIVDLGGL